MFDRADKNKDGRIDKIEFYSIIKEDLKDFKNWSIP
jgi:hypothetical protein